MKRLSAANCKEYILMRLAICGEISCTGIADNAPYSKNYMLAEVKKLRDSGIIHDYRYPDRKRFYRISEPEGSEAISCCGEEAMFHLDLMVGKKGNRYKGTREYRFKQRKLYELCSLFEEMGGIEIDGMEICRATQEGETGAADEYQSVRQNSIFTENGELKSIPTIFSERDDPNKKYFLTSKALNKYAQGAIKMARSEMFRASGILIKGTLLYIAYYMRTAQERWWKDTENQLIHNLLRLAGKELKAFEGNIPVLRRAVFFFPNKKVLTEFVTRSTKKVMINPLDVYNIAYAIPLNEKPKAIIEMLLVDDWMNKVSNLIASSPADPEEMESGWLADGSGMFNLLCCNIGYMKNVAPRVRATNATIVIHDWQEDAAVLIFGSKVKRIVIDSNSFEILLYAVKNNLSLSGEIENAK